MDFQTHTNTRTHSLTLKNYTCKQSYKTAVMSSYRRKDDDDGSKGQNDGDHTMIKRPIIIVVSVAVVATVTTSTTTITTTSTTSTTTASFSFSFPPSSSAAANTNTTTTPTTSLVLLGQIPAFLPLQQQQSLLQLPLVHVRRWS